MPSLERGACDPSNPCTIIWVERLGYLTIPTMAATAQALVAALLLLVPSPVSPASPADDPAPFGGGLIMAKPTNTKGRQSPPSTKPRPSPAKGRPAPGGSGRPSWVVPAAVVACVATLLVAAVVVTQLGGDGGDGGLAQNRPVTVAGTALPAFENPVGDPTVGTVAPTVTGSSFEGRPVQIGGTGRPAMVLFVAHWCPHCQREVPLLAPELGRINPPGVEVITVSTSVRDSDANHPPSAWLERENWPSTVLADDTKASAAQAYGLSGFPYYLLLDRDSKVVARASGEKTVAEVEAMLKRVATTA